MRGASVTILVVFLGAGSLAGCDRPPAGVPPAPAAGTPSGAAPLETGLSLFRRGDEKAAEPYLAQALETAKGDRRVLEALGSIYARSDRFRQAEESFRAALAVDPASISGRLGLAAVLIDTGRYDEALEALGEVRRRDPQNFPALVKGALLEERRGRCEAAEAAARAAIARRPDGAEPHYVLGLCLERRGALEEAAAEMRRVRTSAPDHLGALSHLATLAMRLGKRGEAEEFRRDHAEALRRRRVEDRVRGHRLQGVAAFNREDYAKAIEEFRAILAEDPADPQAHLLLGSANLALGRLDEAQAALEACLRLDARNDRALLELGRLHALAGRLDQAIATLGLAIEANPEFPEPHYFLAGIHRARGEVDLYQEEMRRYGELRARGTGSAMEVVPGPPEGGP